MSRLTHNLNRARNIFLANARRETCHPSQQTVLVELADAIEQAIDHIELQEKNMRTKQQAVDALIALATTQKAQIEDLTAKLAAAPKAEDVVTDAEVAAIDALVPEVPQA